ncbi:MAG: IS5 family transposase [Clostridiales Family XIII bacterium]|jgi:IS5 family transposase|nr:IS5 family transposase [Clostridiales Family XIII bacterium]
MKNIQISAYKSNPLFENQTLEDQLDQGHPLIFLAKAIDWEEIEKQCSKFYHNSHGRVALITRVMVALLLLKYMFDISDERVVDTWSENVYFQAFTGNGSFVIGRPCSPSQMSRFRKRIGEEGCKCIFAESVRIHGRQVLEEHGLIDSTVQEKNISYPTDSKLILKVIGTIKRIGSFLKMVFSRSYKIEIKNLKNQINFGRDSKDNSAKKKAINRLREIANNLLKSFKEQLPSWSLKLYPIKRALMIWDRAINQGKKDKNKIYSVHEPQVQCIAKGKADKKFEFGSKVSFIISKCSGIILGALNFKKNVYDGDTIDPAIKQLTSLHNGYKPKILIGDRGYRGRPEVRGVKIVTPYDCKNGLISSISKKIKRLLGRRVSIEPIIGHLKIDHRLSKNFLKGTLGDTINPLLSAAAFNFLKYTRIQYSKLHKPPRSLNIYPRQRRKKVTNLPLWRKDPNSLFY